MPNMASVSRIRAGRLSSRSTRKAAWFIRRASWRMINLKFRLSCVVNRTDSIAPAHDAAAKTVAASTRAKVIDRPEGHRDRRVNLLKEAALIVRIVRDRARSEV
jgi:hypothetical protein